MFRKMRSQSTLLGALVLCLLLTAGVPVAGATSLQAKKLWCDPAIPFDPSSFTHPTSIDNQWLPLVPGTQFILEGRSNTGGTTLPHTVVLTVTDLTKVIDGVSTVVLWDQDFSDLSQSQLTEAELAFVAQDDAGNVWNLGEYPEEYDVNGVFQGAPSTWISGMAGAKAGIHMMAGPQVGTPPYLQGRVAKIKFLDCGQVYDKGQTVAVPAGTYQDVLVINEWSPRDPAGGTQVKYYAPGVGNVQIGAVNDPQGETLVLVERKDLSPEELVVAREKALALDTQAYEVSQVYRNTPPAE